MRHKKLKTCAVLLLSLGLAGMQAQTKLNVNPKTGAITPFTLNEVKSITFSSGNMYVTKKGGISNSYQLSNIRYLNFESLLTDNFQANIIHDSQLILYPNPVINDLHVQFKSSEECGRLIIFDLQGRIILQQNLNCQEGKNIISVSVNKLSSGIYICRLITGSKIEESKFVKQ